jgi:chromate transport protein ChrA
MLPFWDALRTRPAAQAAMRGTNAAVVGILGAALYNPVWTSAVQTQQDFALVLGGFFLLTVWKLSPWIVVALLAAVGALTGFVETPTLDTGIVETPRIPPQPLTAAAPMRRAPFREAKRA